jgi:hypothetical protein
VLHPGTALTLMARRSHWSLALVQSTSGRPASRGVVKSAPSTKKVRKGEIKLKRIAKKLHSLEDRQKGEMQ